MILVANGKVLATNYFIRDSVYDCYSFSAPMGDYIEEVDLVAEVGNLVRNGVVSLSPEQLREHRNKLLVDSDWTQVADAPVDKAAWAAYRQALRDMPSSPDFPWDAIWPTPPSLTEYSA
jgi:hypothetical protein